MPAPLAVWHLKQQLEKWEPALVAAKQELEKAEVLKGSEAWQTAQYRFRQVEYKVLSLYNDLVRFPGSPRPSGCTRAALFPPPHTHTPTPTLLLPPEHPEPLRVPVPRALKCDC